MNRIMKTIPKPTIQVIHSTMGKIIVFRNPITKGWIGNITIARKPVHINLTNIEVRPNTSIRNLAYACALVSMVLVFFIGCNSTEPDNKGENGHYNVYNHPKACIESFPAIPDTLVLNLTKGTKYQVSPTENNRNRCFIAPDEGVLCHSKERGDTLYTIDRYCPATLKSRTEMGGD